MAHVISGKVKTNMFLNWCGPDGEDIHDNFELEEDEKCDTDHIMEQFKLYCEPFAIFLLPDISSNMSPRGKMRQQMPSIIVFKNSVYNASSMTMKNV